MELNITDGIAGLALLVAILAAVSAGRSATSAESSAISAALANHLAQHNERLSIYKSLQKFHFEFQAHGYGLPDASLWAFSDAANISEFYYPQQVAKELVSIAVAAGKYLAMRDLWKCHQEAGLSGFENARKALAELNVQGPALRKQCKECDDALRKFLRMEPKVED